MPNIFPRTWTSSLGQQRPGKGMLDNKSFAKCTSFSKGDRDDWRTWKRRLVALASSTHGGDAGTHLDELLKLSDDEDVPVILAAWPQLASDLEMVFEFLLEGEAQEIWETTMHEMTDHCEGVHKTLMRLQHRFDPQNDERQVADIARNNAQPRPGKRGTFCRW